MVLEYIQMKKLEEMKQSHKMIIMRMQLDMQKEEHKQKMERLEKQLEIAKVQGLDV